MQAGSGGGRCRQVESKRKQRRKWTTYKAANGHPVGMSLAAPGALHLEGVEEGRLGRVVGDEIRDAAG